MQRLTGYLGKLFATDALILFGIVCLLLWMVQCLRVFDVVSVKGQSILTLAFQGLLTMPPLVLTFAFVCVGIGLARALTALQSSHELHIIHTAGGVAGLVRATALIACLAAVAVLFISNFLAPAANRELSALNASVTADLVSSTLRPGRFTQVTPGVVLLIGGREGDGQISGFFADDRRDPEVRRTYIAESGTVAQTEAGYVLQLADGALQQREPGGRFSEVRFARYDLNVERFTQDAAVLDRVTMTDSLTLVGEALAAGSIEEWPLRTLVQRMSEGLKVIGMCLVVLALAGFPSGRRTRFGLPMEVTVLIIAFFELAVSSYGLFGPVLGPLGGALLMTFAGLGLLGWKFRARPVIRMQTA